MCALPADRYVFDEVFAENFPLEMDAAVDSVSRRRIARFPFIFWSLRCLKVRVEARSGSGQEGNCEMIASIESEMRSKVASRCSS